jgi:hypothetical protein
MEILNTVTQPKTIGDKKSNFLKALRRDNEDLNGRNDKKDEDQVEKNYYTVTVYILFFSSFVAK